MPINAVAISSGFPDATFRVVIPERQAASVQPKSSATCSY